jgi:hypothetical protein
MARSFDKRGSDCLPVFIQASGPCKLDLLVGALGTISDHRMADRALRTRTGVSSGQVASDCRRFSRKNKIDHFVLVPALTLFETSS